MDSCAVRLACVDLPAWPLQLLLRREPSWRAEAAAVVADDSPQAPLLWVNEAARQGGILPGMRYAAALSLDRNLRAGTVAPAAIAAAGDRLHRHLLRYSPFVEPARHEPGVYWLDARGLERLHGSLAAWAARLHRSLTRGGYQAGVAVGFTRFGSYGAARTRPGVTLLPDPQTELAGLRRVPLARLQLDPRVRDDLARLGVRTVGELIDLPAAALGARFGRAVVELHALARGDGYAPLQPRRPAEPLRAQEVLDEPEDDAWRLLFLVKRMLHPLLPPLADRGRAVAALDLALVLADRTSTRLVETLQPAAPSLDAVLLLELVRLRLESLALAAGVERVALTLHDAPAPPEALGLFQQHRARDLAAADRALARVRAEFGDAAVVRAELRSSHLPEESFRWTPLTSLTAAAPGARRPRLVRRLLARPSSTPAPRPEFVRGGPFHVSSGWWHDEVRRAYHFVAGGGKDGDEGELRWVFYDPRRQRWWVQGRVE